MWSTEPVGRQGRLSSTVLCVCVYMCHGEGQRGLSSGEKQDFWLQFLKRWIVSHDTFKVLQKPAAFRALWLQWQCYPNVSHWIFDDMVQQGNSSLSAVLDSSALYPDHLSSTLYEMHFFSYPFFPSSFIIFLSPHFLLKLFLMFRSIYDSSIPFSNYSSLKLTTRNLWLLPLHILCFFFQR